MDAETLFSLCGKVAMAGWVFLIVAPRWRWSAQIIAKFVVPLLLAAIYLGLIATHWSGHRGGFSSLAAVGELFADPWILLAGWVHYLAFDLFIGAWEVRDARRERIPHLLVVPCLVGTFLFGPVGLLAYCSLRTGRRLIDRARQTPEASAPAELADVGAVATGLPGSGSMRRSASGSHC